ncbi:hypothetical protein Scep_030534 [Stephania cephalantha]|uniref:Protein kinase domain-containing protein n=1 Tax=Stephania cephalantha TaxID=152367 RepID=A0AAP0E308_9MAGN
MRLLFIFISIIVIFSNLDPNLALAHAHPPDRPIPRTLIDGRPAQCPMNFRVLRRFVIAVTRTDILNSPKLCQYILQGLRLVQSDFLNRTSLFLPPIDAAQSCWDSYDALLDEFWPGLDIRARCGFETAWISQGCMNITSRSDFESKVPILALNDLRNSCNQSLENNSPCATCTTSLSRLQASYLRGGPNAGNVTECGQYPFIYAAGVVNWLGPTDDGTAKCLFSLDLGVIGRKKRRKGLIWGLWRRRRRRRRGNEGNSISALESMGASTTLVRYSLEDIKEATRNFSREYIIGRGGYGNVFKGILGDGCEVAIKRFKNCSAAGDESFAHEVEVIASIRHVNLVALRGYCIASTPFEGHQSGKKALTSANEDDTSHIADWAWSLVKNERILDVIEDGMPDIGSKEVMEKYVLIAVLCSHPQLYARPTVDQVVKILETDSPVPSIPDRPISIIADMSDIEKSMSSSGSGFLSSSAGYQTFVSDGGLPITVQANE